MPNPLANALNQGRAVYYCSQDIVGPAACQRSDTLGASFGPGVLAYNGVTTQCGGLHGHVHVAPNGTVWLPVNQCGGHQGGAVSTDSGTTWNEFIVTGSVSQGNGADPSIALDSDSTAYFCYVNNEPVALGNPPEGHVHVKVSHDGGATWINDFDLGASHGIKNAAHTEAVGGSPGRAACGFIGTNVAGDYQAGSFTGKWYAFIATTYDGGLTWTTINATPNDPVQNMTGIWQQGGGNQDRNLLDFNEITVDDKGRVLYGYSDGCTSGPCIAVTAPNDYTAHMRVARQFGGKSLFSQFDSVEPAAPKPACLSGTRTAASSHLTWKIPDNGGSDITGYQVLRGTTAGSETVLVSNTGSSRNRLNDTTALPAVPHYFYVVKAINGVSPGSQSSEVDLDVSMAPPAENACTQPGLTILSDPPDDELDMLPAHDVQSLRISEPFAFAPNQVVFTLKMQSLATVPPDSQWPVTFNAPNGINYTVRMTNVPADGATTAPIFQIGPTAGPFVAAAAGSNFNADGTITIIAPTSAFGSPTVGQNLTGFLTRIAANVGVATITPDNMPDSLTPTGSYTIVGNQSCASPTPTPTPTVTPTPTPSASPTPTPTTIQFGNTIFAIGEAVTSVPITVTRSGPASGVSTVDYVVSNGTATQRGDYTYASGTVAFAANETSKIFPVLISDDGYAEGSETATITLSNPVGAILGSPNTATLQIDDNEASPAPGNPIDDAAIFVGEHYHDFLNRQSDPDGQNFWTNQITSCGNDASCLSEKRTNVSAAFFLSIEFQNTGYFAFRFYRASFADSAGRPRGLPRYLEFLRDEQKLQHAVVVGQQNWEFVLEQNKQGFALDWVDRADFIAEYPTTMTRDDYIDKLFMRSAASPTTQERNRALFAYDSGGSLKEKRAQGIRAVIDAGSVYNAQYNPAFVLMQYFGYLRRNPDDAPDNNFSGYDFWLNKMNQFSVPGEDVQDDDVALARVKRAEMVKAFLVSGEYRQRFAGSPGGNQEGSRTDGDGGTARWFSGSDRLTRGWVGELVLQTVPRFIIRALSSG